ncbi:MAG: hypothetical protein HS113_19150 [Verrucomicrobiales bacterium]|nr:hypothetical protein [Verrucomicrobiales bacterium]
MSAFIEDHAAVYDLAHNEVAQGQTLPQPSRPAYEQVQQEAEATGLWLEA